MRPRPDSSRPFYEHRSEALLPRHLFFRRVANHAAAAGALVCFSLLGGVLGYRFLAQISWIDALLNASMILSGMGPVNELTSVPAKIFASAYALYSGIAFLVVSAMIIAPFAHRLLHRLHLDQRDD